MFVKKYNKERKVFERVEIPDDWKCVTFKELLNTTINCANCGKIVKYADTYISREIFKGNIDSCGCSVCKECFRKESRSRKETSQK